MTVISIKINILDDHDINYTTWTSDIALNWWFAQGSQISLVWKNGIDNERNSLINTWTENIKESFNLAQENSISLKNILFRLSLHQKMIIAKKHTLFLRQFTCFKRS